MVKLNPARGLKRARRNCYVDAGFDTDPDDSKSQTGYVFLLNGGAVSWCSSKQSVVAGSTCEAEYMLLRKQQMKESR